MLSNIFGLRKRRTYDIDYSLVKEKLNQDNIAKMLNDIFMNKNEENIKFEISNIKTNMKRNKYSGLDVFIKCILATIEEIIHLDISTGNTAELFNREYTFMYQMNNNVSKAHVYKNELIIAQKLQTMMYFDYMNSRIKDYYDVFLILKNNPKLDYKLLKEAIIYTCNNRHYLFDKRKNNKTTKFI